MKQYIILGFMLLLSLSSPIFADSLWKEGTRSPYTKSKDLKVGDIITVQIVESTTALQQAQTNLSKQSDVEMDVFSSWERIADIVSNAQTRSGRQRNEADLSGADAYKGQGQTTRKSVLKAIITVMVVSELGDGVYRVEGNHEIRVNEETERINIKGLIRANDVQNDNTINSYQIANANISVEGQGSVSSKQNPGIISRLFDWLF